MVEGVDAGLVAVLPRESQRVPADRLDLHDLRAGRGADHAEWVGAGLVALGPAAGATPRPLRRSAMVLVCATG